MWELEAERYDPKPQNFDVQIERQETYLRTKRETFKIKAQKHLGMENEIHIWNSCFKFEMQFGDVWRLARLWNSMEKFERS